MYQERVKNKYKKIKLPLSSLGQDRGYKQCCTAELVLANGSVFTWENDICPMWIKLSDVTDSHEFKITTCDNEVVNYVIESIEFPNEPNAYYAQINWKDVLASDDIGKYKLSIEYIISGIPGVIEWGIYDLQQFTIERALTTARLRAVFNHYHEIEQINFKGSNLQGTIRFNGFIGNRQPNKYIDNLIYSNREIKSNVRENLNSYELKTDPISECITSKLIDLYLLSEVELYASDYNAFNHSYSYNDIPVTIEETEEVEYKELNRLANVNAKLVDKFRNERTFFK